MYLFVDQFSLLDLHFLHHRKQLPENHEHAGTGRDDHGRWQDQEENWEDQLDANLVGLFLGLLAAPHAHEIRVGPQGFRNAGSESIGLNENCHQFLDLILAGTAGQMAESVGALKMCIRDSS